MIQWKKRRKQRNMTENRNKARLSIKQQTEPVMDVKVLVWVWLIFLLIEKEKKKSSTSLEIEKITNPSALTDNWYFHSNVFFGSVYLHKTCQNNHEQKRRRRNLKISWSVGREQLWAEEGHWNHYPPNSEQMQGQRTEYRGWRRSCSHIHCFTSYHILAKLQANRRRPGTKHLDH